VSWDLPALAGFTVREVADADAPALIALIGGCYAEYPGCVLDLPGVDADLCKPATVFGALGGQLWVVSEGSSGLIACVGLAPAHAPPTPWSTAELKRLYVAASHRRRGLARALCLAVENAARAQGATSLELWSDSRFTSAHALYESMGYARLPEQRALHDPSQTVEFSYLKPL
jgi:putative acetyltransferase